MWKYEIGPKENVSVPWQNKLQRNERPRKQQSAALAQSSAHYVWKHGPSASELNSSENISPISWKTSYTFQEWSGCQIMSAHQSLFLLRLGAVAHLLTVRQAKSYHGGGCCLMLQDGWCRCDVSVWEESSRLALIKSCGLIIWSCHKMVKYC